MSCDCTSFYFNEHSLHEDLFIWISSNTLSSPFKHFSTFFFHRSNAADCLWDFFISISSLFWKMQKRKEKRRILCRRVSRSRSPLFVCLTQCEKNVEQTDMIWWAVRHFLEAKKDIFLFGSRFQLSSKNSWTLPLKRDWNEGTLEGWRVNFIQMIKGYAWGKLFFSFLPLMKSKGWNWKKKKRRKKKRNK